jgi:hypothetical protein
MGSQLHSSAALLLGKQSPVPTAKETGWALKRREKSVSPNGHYRGMVFNHSTKPIPRFEHPARIFYLKKSLFYFERTFLTWECLRVDIFKDVDFLIRDGSRHLWSSLFPKARYCVGLYTITRKIVLTDWRQANIQSSRNFLAGVVLGQRIRASLY